MAKRVYELSKQYGVSNKELLDLLKEHGVELTSIAVAPQHVVELVEKLLGGKTAAKKTEAAPVKPTPVAKPTTPVEKPAEKKAEAKPAVQPIKTEITPKPITAPGKVAAEKPAPVAAKPAPVPQPKPPLRPTPPPISEKKEIKGPEPLRIVAMTVGEFAQKTQKPVGDVIMTLLKQGIAATINKVIPDKVVAQLATHYELAVAEKVVEAPKKETSIKETHAEGTWQERLPVVVVIGHVDHGKTTLLDFIRKTRVAAREKGGITQHLGAYEVKMAQGNCVFLDTPGHEAFSLMRARGIRVADIAILVVAADDGVMPQTIEAIKRAQAAEVPIIVAINKVDKASIAQIEVVKRQLAQENLVPEDWGGQTICQQISAKLGTGIDALLDVIILQSQMMDLKANISVPAKGYILESHMEKGRGPVATVICQHGIVKVGDYFAAGTVTGRVSSLVDSYGKRVTQLMPSHPAQVAGFSELPQVGDIFEVVTQQEAKRGVGPSAATRPDALQKRTGQESETELTLIVKADNASSREALVNALGRLKSEHRTVSIIYAGVGDISESDLMLAADTGSIMYGFHVKSQPGVQALATKKGVVIKNFDIIYKLIEDVEQLLEAGKPIKMITKKIGEAAVLKVFDIKGLGIIAGAHVKTGRFINNGKVTVWRGKNKAGEGTIKGLQRDRKSVKEVHAGFECAFLVDGFDTWEIDDRVECFQEIPA